MRITMPTNITNNNRSKKDRNRILYILIIIPYISLILGDAQIDTLFEDNFDDVGLNNWIKYGSPLPAVISSYEGRNGVFDNNGDSMYDSSVVSKNALSLGNGFTMESDIYLKVTNPSGCWAGTRFGLTDQSEPAGLSFGIAYEGDACWQTPSDKRRHAYIGGGFITESGSGENIGSWINGDAYINGWHRFKIVVGQDRYVKYYIDDTLIYTSTNRISSSLLNGQKLSISGRSSGSAGKAYNDYIKILAVSDQPSDLVFKGIDLVPKTGTNLIANNEAKVLLTVENAGYSNIPAGKWNVNLYFNDLWGKNSDLLETLWKKQTIVVQERNLQVDFPEVPPGETTIEIPILLNMRDPINYKDQYMAYADQLVVCGNPVPLQVDCTNDKHLAVKDIYIKSNIVGDEVECIWGIFNLVALAYVKNVLKIGGSVDEQRAWTFIQNLATFTAEVFHDCATGEPDVPKYFIHAGEQLITLADIVAQGSISILQKAIVIINFIETIYDIAITAGHCISMINAWMAEATTVWNDMGILYNMIIINHGTEAIITNTAGETIHITDEEITKGIPDCAAFFIPDGVVVLVPGSGNLDLWIKGTKSSTMEIICVGPKGINGHVYDRFEIDVEQGTILATKYTKEDGYKPISIDFDGDGKIDSFAYPDNIRKTFIDIKPGGCPNPINLNSMGVIPVALLGTEDFDVNTVDPKSISLGREGIEKEVKPIRWNFAYIASPFEGRPCNCHKENDDGYKDIIMHFDVQNLITNLELKKFVGSSTPLKLTAKIKNKNEDLLLGQDCIKVVPGKSNRNKAHGSRHTAICLIS